ncbi:MAG TPA: MFS transporter [Thermomicrobiales bacterium]|nr:MFS transporter [Thermomicrobiales bacterium]
MSADAPAAGSSRSYASLRHRDFRLLWTAEFVSSTGTQIQRVAVAWQIFEVSRDPLALGVLGLCRFVPILLFGIAGGVFADRYDRRRTLLISQIALLACSTAFAAMTILGAASLAAIYALTIIASIFAAVAGPTRQALIPTLVPREELAGAMSMNVLASQVATVGGPAIGGVLLGALGIGAAYTVDAISFGVVAIAVIVLRTRPAVVRQTISGWAAAVEGLRFLRDSPGLLAVMILDFVATFFGASTVLMPVFATDVLGIGPAGLGLLLAAPAAGAVAGGAVMAVARTPNRPGLGVVGAVIVYGACIFGFGLSRNPWLSLALLAGGGAADAVSMAMRHTVRNLLSPDELRGRIAAAHSTFAMGGPQLGEFESGLLAARFGAPAAVASGGALAILAALLIAWRLPAISAFRLSAPRAERDRAHAAAD